MSRPFLEERGFIRVRGPGQRGLTLIELMIAMVVSSLLVGFIFAIHSRMSLAYRSQSSVTEVQQVVRMAKDMIVRDVRAAGYMMPRGLQVSAPVVAGSPMITSPRISPIIVRNDPDGIGPDSIHLFYADPSAAARITGIPAAPTEAPVTNDSIFYDTMGLFQEGLAVIVGPPSAAGVYERTCLVWLTGAAPGMLFFNTGPRPYNTATNDHCIFGSPPESIITSGSMIYRAIANAYRIDPTRMAAAVLQISRTGGLEDDWEDIGFGFTDLQIARRYVEQTDSDGDLDLDGDPRADWYSGTVAPPLTARLTDVNISIVARTFRQVTGVGTSETPALMNPTNVNHNSLGDSPSIPLAGVPDAARPVQHRGNHVYRWISERVDIRNPLGEGL
jgi:prepilin-type N-terminal cleavage/methylation domain-containing protein